MTYQAHLWCRVYGGFKREIQGRVAGLCQCGCCQNVWMMPERIFAVVNGTPESLVEPVADAKNVVPTSLDEALKKATKDNPTLLSHQHET